MARKRQDKSKNLYRITCSNAHYFYRESELGLKEFAEGNEKAWRQRGFPVTKVDLVEAAEVAEKAEEEAPKKRGPGRPRKSESLLSDSDSAPE